MVPHRVSTEIGGREFLVETGEVAKQAGGAVWVTYGDTVVLVTATASAHEVEQRDFAPLTVDYRERAFAAGKIPGGFFKREGRPTEREIIISRLVDRSIRPLMPKGFRRETQIICTALSADRQTDPDILSLVGASAAVTISDIPLADIVGGVRVGLIDGNYVVNPTYQHLEMSSLHLVVSGTKDGILMVESGADQVSEAEIVGALSFAQEYIRKLVEIQEKLQAVCGKEKILFQDPTVDPELEEKVRSLALEKVREAVVIPEKLSRQNRMAEVKEEVLSAFPEDDEAAFAAKTVLEKIEKEEVRNLIITRGIRADGRGLEDIRPITCRVGVLPRTHGSALFTRGETQALVVSTLGTALDEQRLDDLEGKPSKSFMLHYNFPPYCVGEVRRMLGPGRREIGHGFLAERAFLPVLPPNGEFPYTIRVVSEILESNGSSSMATVCGGSLSLMDAGVPIKAPVAGIAMGLVKDGDDFYILSDILGLEDHLGDMDFKVAGTAEGITALQMDIKMGGIPEEVMARALEQARIGRLHVLERMSHALERPRENLSEYAPRILTLKIKPEKVREVIGPGGKVIRGIIEKTGVTIDVEDDGTILVISTDLPAAERAMEIIKDITQEAEIGKIYDGIVKKTTDFGAFVEIFPGTDGLVHISQIAPYRVGKVTDVLREGDRVTVKVLDVDRDGKIRLSRKDALKEEDRNG